MEEFVVGVLSFLLVVLTVAFFIANPLVIILVGIPLLVVWMAN